MIIKEKYHWFCLSYYGKKAESGLDCQASVYVANTNKCITRKDIDGNKKFSGINDGAVLMSASYLGIMALEEFNG